MRIIGYATNWDESEGLQPIELQDLQIVASPKELEQVVKFLGTCTEKLLAGTDENDMKEFPDSKTNPKTGITIQVLNSDESAL